MADHNGNDGNGETQDNGRQMRVDSALVRELAELVASNDLSEIEVEDGDRKIRVRREVLAAPVAAAAPMMLAAAPAAVAAAPAAVPAADAAPEYAEADLLRSPMVGTCYLSAEPGSRPFATPGTAVKEGDTLLIVEAMKVMNPILAPKSGVVRQLLVSNAQPVEYDQPLVVIG
jgi:acetyl-CoA carboxylase biotin carboxyl carrier protein